MLYVKHLQTSKFVVNIHGTVIGTISSIWEAITSAQKAVNMWNTFFFKDTRTYHALFVNYRCGSVA